MYTIQRISSQLILPLRKKYLRQKEPLEACHFENDDHSQSVHFGAFNHDTLVGAVSLIPEIHRDFDLAPQFRIRGLMVEEAHRGHRLATKLCQTAFTEAFEKGATLVWCYARPASARVFESLGMHPHGAGYQHPERGPHQLYVIKKNG